MAGIRAMSARSAAARDKTSRFNASVAIIFAHIHIYIVIETITIIIGEARRPL